MKARILIESAALGPDDLKIAGQAFDSAWSQIATHYKSPEAVEAARMRLATVRTDSSGELCRTPLTLG